MLTILKNFLRPPEAKASRTAQLVQLAYGASARWTPREAAAVAVDVDPEHEPMNRRHISHMPQIVIDAFKAEGAYWGGDFRSRQDPMHFQFATE